VLVFIHSRLKIRVFFRRKLDDLTLSSSAFRLKGEAGANAQMDRGTSKLGVLPNLNPGLPEKIHNFGLLLFDNHLSLDHNISYKQVLNFIS
jgi:hypothetical protein